MKLKKVLALIMMLTLVIGCVACGNTNNANSTDPTAVPTEAAGNSETEATPTTAATATAAEDVITIMVPPVTNTYLEKIALYAEEFHALYPNLTLEVTETSWDNHIEKLNTTALAGEAPDIAEISYATIGSYVEMGVAINIADYLAADRLADYDQNALDYMTLEGVTYGLPLYITIQAIGANKEKLEAAGVDVASVQQNGWTFADFKTAIANGTVDDCFGFVFASSAATAADYLNIFFFFSCLTNPFTSELKYAYTSQNMLNLLTAISEMSESGYIPNYGVEASQRMVMCETGNAMIFGKAMPLFEGNINKNNAAIDANDGTAVEGSIKLEYAFLPIPTMDGVTESCYGTVDGLVALRNNNTTD